MSTSIDRGTATAPIPAARLHYSLIIEWDPRDNIYVVTVPELPGCQTHGETYEEAISQVQEAIEMWIEGAVADGEVPPDATVLSAPTDHHPALTFK